MSKEILKDKKPYFAKETENAFQQLRVEASKIVNRLLPERRSEIVWKAILFPLMYFACWTSAILFGTHSWVLFTCYFLMGIAIPLNYLNVIHDSVHYTIFKNRRINALYKYLFDLMGANSFIWETRHIRYHHNYPNVDGWDTDIDQSVLIRVSPHSRHSRFHKYQHLYLPFIYPLFLFNWLLVRDFRDFFDRKRTVHKLISPIPRVEFVKLFIFKIVFLAAMVVLPKIILGISWLETLAAFCLMIFTASIFALIVLLPPHANTGSEFPIPDDKRKLPYTWFMHMLKTTNDVSGENWFSRFVLGNYNYHIVHHLFPNIHHIFYPEITQVLKQMAERYNLPYRSYPLGVALKRHYRLLKLNESDFDLWEESM
ncbi:MAG: fatty acid desaturase [Chitinophagaceae bacterium]|nr:fatty acid desaturase [Chitinophagaceae bacterium]